MLGKNPVQQFALANIAFVQGNAVRQGIAVAGKKIVNDNDFFTTRQQGTHIVGTDVAGTASQKDGFWSGHKLRGTPCVITSLALVKRQKLHVFNTARH